MRNKQALATDAIHVEQNVIGKTVGHRISERSVRRVHRITSTATAVWKCSRIVAKRERLAALEQHCALFLPGFQNCVGNCQRADTLDSARKQELGNDVSDGQ